MMGLTTSAVELNIEGADALVELALNLHWSWNHASDELWEHLDPELWAATQNPWVILRTVSKEKIKAALAVPAFHQRVEDVLRRNRESYKADSWFQEKHPAAPLAKVAYFSMEFMLSEALPIYSGGLGNVAGDQLKAASDLGVPVVGIGLLYGQGYFRQDFDAEGRQQALYPVNDPGQLPISPLRRPDGEWLRLQIQLPGSSLWVRCWEVSVGRTKLYLLDTNDFANTAAQRGITSQLYGGDAEMRLKQEIVLGIGGWRLLRALGLRPEVCHLNEGHAALAVLERARCYMEDEKVAFAQALTTTRAGNVFTTHTAVTAGFDRFDPALVRKHLTHYAVDELGISLDDLLAMGRLHPSDEQEPLNMAYLALRCSGRINGVSKLHGKVSRHIFQPLFPRRPEEEVPISSVTNGIHVPSWDSEQADALWTKACGKKRWHGEHPTGDEIRSVADAELWAMRRGAKESCTRRIRARYARQLASEGVTGSGDTLQEHVMTMGFARRFATYKRPDLMLHDPDRLIGLLSNPKYPLQLILAGKAHPQDLPGQALIQRWNDFARRPEVRGRVVFLSDYDMLLAQEMVQGVDLWVNTPRRPWEACGTSGMKVLANGGLNVSELDGWWAEAYAPDIGWAVGNGKEHGEDTTWDSAEAEALYALLEREIIPEFYDQNDRGLPTKWLSRVRESMARLTPEFSAGRAIREYTETAYLPAAVTYQARAADNGRLGLQLTEWHRSTAQHWSGIRFSDVCTETRYGQHFFRVQVSPGDLNPAEIAVELYAAGTEPEKMAVCTTCADSSGEVTYTAEVPATRPANDYTARVVPFHEGASVPLEAGEILWQR